LIQGEEKKTYVFFIIIHDERERDRERKHTTKEVFFYDIPRLTSASFTKAIGKKKKKI
jgi:hypothetical protein